MAMTSKPEQKQGWKGFNMFRRKKTTPPPPIQTTKMEEPTVNRGVRVNTKELVGKTSKENGTDMYENHPSFIEHVNKCPVEVPEFTAVEDDLSNYRHMRLNANIDRALACGPSRDTMGHRGLDDNEHPAVDVGLDIPLVTRIIALIDANSATNLAQSYLETLESEISHEYERSEVSARSAWTIMGTGQPKTYTPSTEASDNLTDLNKKAGATSVNAVQVNHVLAKMVERGEISPRDMGMIKGRIYERARERGTKVNIDDIKAGVKLYTKPVNDTSITNPM